MTAAPEINSAGGPADCLRSLRESGRARVSPWRGNTAETAAAETPGLWQELQRWDIQARETAGLELPPLEPTAALWAARTFHQLCQGFACRGVGAPELKAGLSTPGPAAGTPAIDWSVDLTFHHLPALFELVRRTAPGDPLLEILSRLAADWPLSSVGCPGLPGPAHPTCPPHPGLLRLYADRVTATRDWSRLGDPGLADLLLADLGEHPELAPELAAQLTTTRGTP